MRHQHNVGVRGGGGGVIKKIVEFFGSATPGQKITKFGHKFPCILHFLNTLHRPV